MFQRILVPVDGSGLAERVLPVVEHLARAFGGTVTLLHIVERTAPATVHGERHLTGRAEAEHYLAELAGRLRREGIECVEHVHDLPHGDVAAGIAWHAAEAGADLIVLCTHGSGGMRGALWGTIAQQVLQHGSAPVLLVRAEAIEVPTVFAPRTILVSLDGTAASEAAIEPAARIARTLGAYLRLTLVVPTMETLRDQMRAAALVRPTGMRDILDRQERQAAVYLDEIAAPLRQDGVLVETEVSRGDAAEVLAKEAVEHGVGLVVAATRGRAGVQAIWTGSTVPRLLSRTRAPILLIRILDQ